MPLHVATVEAPPRTFARSVGVLARLFAAALALSLGPAVSLAQPGSIELQPLPPLAPAAETPQPPPAGFPPAAAALLASLSGASVALAQQSPVPLYPGAPPHSI